MFLPSRQEDERVSTMSCKLMSGLGLACTLVAALAFAPASANAVVVLTPADVAGYWAFNNSGNLGLDSGAYGNHLTATFGSPSYVASGVFGGAIDLGTGSTLTTVSGLFPTAVPVGNESFTIAFWEKAYSTNTAGGGVIGWGWGPSTSNAVRVNNDAVGAMVGHTFWDNSPATPDFWLQNLSPAPRAGGWNQVTFTYDSSTGTRKGYYNGVLIGSMGNGTAPPNVSAQGFALGKSIWGQNFNGQLDDVLIVKRALSDAEVAALQGGVTLIPEPSTVVLLTLGLIGLLAYAWRKRK